MSPMTESFGIGKEPAAATTASGLKVAPGGSGRVITAMEEPDGPLSTSPVGTSAEWASCQVAGAVIVAPAVWYVWLGPKASTTATTTRQPLKAAWARIDAFNPERQ